MPKDAARQVDFLDREGGAVDRIQTKRGLRARHRGEKTDPRGERILGWLGRLAAASWADGAAVSWATGVSSTGGLGVPSTGGLGASSAGGTGVTSAGGLGVTSTDGTGVTSADGLGVTSADGLGVTSVDGLGAVDGVGVSTSGGFGESSAGFFSQLENARAMMTARGKTELHFTARSVGKLPARATELFEKGRARRMDPGT